MEVLYDWLLLPATFVALSAGVAIGHRLRAGAAQPLVEVEADEASGPPVHERRAFFANAALQLVGEAPWLLAIVDIDALTDLEDYAGLSVADNATALATHQLTTHLPPSWLLGKTGDARFALLAPYADAPLVHRQLEALVARIGEQPLCQDGKVIELDVRCGFASSDHYGSFDELYLAASRAARQAQAPTSSATPQAALP